MAPGLHRRFIAEDWPQLPRPVWEQAREEARSQATVPLEMRLQAGDLDPAAIEQAKHNARIAGVADDIDFHVRAADDWRDLPEYGCLIANPPYGERLSSKSEVESLYRNLGRFCNHLPTWSIYVLTAFPEFEETFGRRADRRRKLYNAKIACTYYQYLGPKPPRGE
jgi:putative N6-adenine-specific DNA methylase